MDHSIIQWHSNQHTLLWYMILHKFNGILNVIYFKTVWIIVLVIMKYDSQNMNHMEVIVRFLTWC